MGLLSTTRYFPASVGDLSPAAQDVMTHFSEQGYQVTGEETLSGGWHISVREGTIFKMIAGMSTALQIDVERAGDDAIVAKTSIGIVGAQAVPTALSLLVYPPLVLAQVWGLVRQYKLDEEAMEYVGHSLSRHSRAGAAHSAGMDSDRAPRRATAHEAPRRVCSTCGAEVERSLKFCTECGTQA